MSRPRAPTLADDEDDGTPLRAPTHERFEILERIGEGGTGVVYRAFDRRLGLPVALKALRRSSPAAIARLKSEFRVRAELQHPSLLMHYDLLVDAADALISMELVEGSDLLAALRSGAIADGDGLLSVARQVLAGLQALHAAGLVHCDVKPENILITADGRALLTDFGLAQRFVPDAVARGGARGPAGTPRYIAPELIAGDEPRPGADLYAFGVSLDDALAFLVDGSSVAAASLRALARRLSVDSPEQRPTALASLTLLDDGLTSRRSHLDLRTRGIEDPFVGREAELAALRAALASTGGLPVVAHVFGPSGVGKSGLVQRLLRECAGRPETVVLAGQCHPSEHLDYRGIDGVVDGLAHQLSVLGTTVVDGLSTLQRHAVTRHFPSLHRVPGLSLDKPLLVPSSRDLRRIAWEALRLILVRICEVRRVLLWIDDLQWADDDALALLSDLQGGADAPRAFYLFSYRLDDEAARRRLSPLRPISGASHVDHREVPLSPLSVAETEALLGALVPELTASPDRLAALSREVGGYPVFARVAARDPSVAIGVAGEVGERLTQVFNRAVEALPEAERQGLDSLSLAERPLSVEVTLDAIGSVAPMRALAALERAGLVTRVVDEAGERYQPTHDRLRQARLSAVDSDDRRSLHRRLAISFERRAPDELEALALHWSACGEERNAGGYALRAADRAAEQLSFGVAARHYADALRWLPPPEAGHGVRRKLAEALSNQGLGRRAAEEYERCSTEAPAAAGAALRQLAAEQYFHCGDVDEGYRLLRQTLRHHGVRLPGSRWECLASSLALRARLVGRGTRFSQRTEAQVRPDDRALLDTLWTGATSLAHVNHALGDVFHLRHLLHALEVGEPRRLLRAITYEVAAEQTIGGAAADAHCRRLMAQAEALVEAEGREYDRGWYWVAHGATQTFRGDWRAVVRAAERAETHLDRHQIGVSWERAINNGYWLTALAMRGEVAPFAERHRVALADARARQDALAEGNCCSGYGSMLWLYRDEPSLVRERALSAPRVTRWHGDRPSALAAAWPVNLLSTTDYHDIYAAAQLALYEGDGGAAYAAVASVWEHLERAMLLRVQFVGADLRFLLGRAAIAAGAGRGAPTGAKPSVLHARAGRIAAELARDRNPVARAYAVALRALVIAARGGPREGAEGLVRAAEEFAGCAMEAHAEASRWRAAALRGDVSGRAASTRRLAALGMAAPERVVDLLVPAP